MNWFEPVRAEPDGFAPVNAPSGTTMFPIGVTQTLPCNWIANAEARWTSICGRTKTNPRRFFVFFAIEFSRQARAFTGAAAAVVAIVADASASGVFGSETDAEPVGPVTA